MDIQIRKGQNSPDVLTCLRENGTSTIMELKSRSVYHELSHYAVETTLGYTAGFWGMIKNGLNIDDYDLENELRGVVYSPESYHAEFMASLIQAAVSLGRIDTNYVEMLKKGSKDWGLSFPELPAEDILEKMRLLAADWIRKWEELAPGEDLLLNF